MKPLSLMDDQLLVELTRGGIAESVHTGSAAVADAHGRLLAWVGDPERVTFLRSTAKPFQALPLVERGGLEMFAINPQELAIICASHTGTEAHVAVVRALQARLGVGESDLLCGVHPPTDRAAAAELTRSGGPPFPLQHNCSGKHTGMLALALHFGQALPTYLEPEGAVQQALLKAFAEMCGLDLGQVVVGTDGCSAPNFAVPLRNAAWGLARLADPGGLPAKRAAACRQITRAMMSHPEMVSGPGQFDTRLMQAAPGKLVCKGGAEGYTGLALLPGARGEGSPGLGVAIKIADGDPSGRARSAVTLEVLSQLGVLTGDQAGSLADFGAGPATNFRGVVVGERRARFRLRNGAAPI